MMHCPYCHCETMVRTEEEYFCGSCGKHFPIEQIEGK